MGLTRRQLVGTLAGTLPFSAGCVGRRWWESDQDAEGSSAGNQSEAQSSAENETETDATNPDENAAGDRDENTTDAAERESENETEPSNDTGEEADDSTRPTTVEIDDPDAVETEAEAIHHESSVEVRGKITNTSATEIDQITIDVILYNGDGDEIFRRTDGTVGLVEWSSWEFSVIAEGAKYAEAVDEYEVVVAAEQYQGE